MKLTRNQSKGDINKSALCKQIDLKMISSAILNKNKRQKSTTFTDIIRVGKVLNQILDSRGTILGKRNRDHRLDTEKGVKTKVVKYDCRKKKKGESKGMK